MANLIWDNNPGNASAKPGTVSKRLIAHGAITKGKVYTMDLSTATAATYGAVTTTKATSATAAVEEGEIHVIAMEDVTAAQATAGYRAEFLIQGAFEAVSGGSTAEAALSIDSSGRLADAANSTHTWGVALETASANATHWVWFWGDRQTWVATA